MFQFEGIDQTAAHRCVECAPQRRSDPRQRRRGDRFPGLHVVDDVLTGAELEGLISGRDASDCEEAAGATRIKRLRDTLGNQMVSELLVKNIARRGYMLAVEKDVIRVL